MNKDGIFGKHSTQAIRIGVSRNAYRDFTGESGKSETTWKS
jgi:hypothetical protein